jgi:sec-independent protein translocase protein TatC
MAPKPHDDKRMELTEHLGELRTRLIRSILYLVVGAIVAYQFFTPLYEFMYRPLQKEIVRINDLRAVRRAHERAHAAGLDFDPLHLPSPHNPPTVDDIVIRDRAITWMYTHPSSGTELSGQVFHGFADPFLVRLKLSIILGFILVTPLIVREVALFIAPALTAQERRPLRILIPISILLLMFGVVIAYLTLFFAMQWFLSYLDDFPQGATLLQNPDDYIIFFVKMMAAFGVAFQLPVVLMGGAFLNLITSKGLLKHWRWGIVIAVLGGVFTPSNDLISMALMSFPLLLLYFSSIFLVKIVEKMKQRSEPGPT